MLKGISLRKEEGSDEFASKEVLEDIKAEMICLGDMKGKTGTLQLLYTEVRRSHP